MPRAQRSARADQVLQLCQGKFLDAAPDITDAMIGKAKEGSHQHAKFLFDVLNFAAPKTRSDDDDDDLEGPTLAEILLERLELLQNEEADAPVEGAAQA